MITTGQNIQKCPAYPDTIEMVQTNGYRLKCFIKGDEYFSILTTIDGYPLLENKDGGFEYVVIDSIGNIKANGINAKNITDRTQKEKVMLESIDKNSLVKILQSDSNQLSTMNINDLSYSLLDFPRTGIRRLLVLLIDFTDQAFTIAANNFNNLMNQVNYNSTGSFRDYLLANSYNGLTVNSTIGGWYNAANNMAQYGANLSGNLGDDNNHRLLVREAIDAAENTGIDFSLFDNDNDGSVDGIIVVHAGYGEEAGGGANTIWSKHSTLGSLQRTYDGVTISDYAIVPELRGNFGNNITNIGVICHEFGHSLGLPDLYDTDDRNGTSEGIGRWGLMGSGNWNNNGASPSNFCGWSKIYLGWSNPITLSNATSIYLSNSAQNNIFYRINTPHSNEYFLLENRQFVGFDVGLPGTGLAIWHINTSKTSSGHINNNDVNADENLKGVDLEEADGRNDLDNNVNRGDNGDLFSGNSCNRVFRDNTNPSSQTYAPVVNSNKPITNVVEVNNIIRFDFLNNIPISNNSPVCTSNKTFSLQNQPSGLNPAWSNSSNLVYVVGQGTYNYVVKASSGSLSENGWVEVNLTPGACNPVIIRRDVWIGSPSIPASIIGFCCNGMEFGSESLYTFNVNHATNQSVNQYSWVVACGTIIEGQGTRTITVKTCKVTGSQKKYFDVHVMVGNSCGWSAYLWRTGYVTSGEGPTMYSVYPNPTSSEVTISVSDANSLSPTIDNKDIYINNIKIVDSYGNTKKIKQCESGLKTITINISDLQQGVYLIKINDGLTEETHKLMVE